MKSIRIELNREAGYKSYSFPFGEILDAIEKNGLPQARGDFWVRGYDDSVISACAIGMAAINLKVDFNDLKYALDQINLEHPFHDNDCMIDGGGECYYIYDSVIFAGDKIVEMNDEEGLNFKQIADYIRTKYPEALKAEVVFNSWEFRTDEQLLQD